MASRRALLALPLRTTSILSRPIATACRSSGRQKAGPVALNRAIPISLQQTRRHSVPPSRSNVYDFEDVKAWVESPDHTARQIIDVREPSELEATGFIPTALNMPLNSQPDALFLSPEDFEDRFGFAKPPLTKELVFYCKAGVRSSAAAQLALQHGYQKVGEYRGSWLDWEKRGGAGIKGGNPDGPGGQASGPPTGGTQ